MFKFHFYGPENPLLTMEQNTITFITYWIHISGLYATCKYATA
jgi:hypothetical protein